jgi:HK97 family phage major capsid protein
MSLESTINELRDKRANVIAKAREILDKADSEKRAMTAEENQTYDRLVCDDPKKPGEAQQLQSQYERYEAQLAAERSISNPEPINTPDNLSNEQIDAARAQFPWLGDMLDAQRDTLTKRRNVQRSGKRTDPERRYGEEDGLYQARCRRSTPEYARAFNDYLLSGPHALMSHQRALQSDKDIVGGYLVAPQQWSDQLIKFIDNAVVVRQKATKYTLVAAASLGVPSLDTDIDDSDWTAELLTGNEDSAMRFGKRELTPHPFAKRIKVSNELIRIGTHSPDALVQNRMSYKMAVTEEKAFMTGTGANQPLGVYTASANGISTGQDVTCGTTTDFTADGLMDMIFSLKPQYQARGEWMFHRLGLKRVRKLKDGMGQYLWQPGLQAGSPDTLLSRPVNQSEYNPSTFTSQLYTCMFADWSFYWVVDVNQIPVQRLLELYAATNQTGFIGRRLVDGMPVLEEAFARGKLA